MTVVVVIVLAALAVIALVLMLRARRSKDTVDSFRRGLDALSPEARRPVIDQVHRVARPDDELDVGGSPATGDDPDRPDDDPSGPGGARGA